MKKSLLSLFALACITANAQIAGTPHVFGEGKFIEQEPTLARTTPTEKPTVIHRALKDASYQLPVPLTYLGTISQDDNAVCNLLFRHKAINGGAFLLASTDKGVLFKNTSKGSPTAFNWTIPGSNPSTSTAQDAMGYYSTPGIYNMPTLKITSPTGNSTYTSNLTIKVGGKAEITTIDCREWGTTYMLSALQYGNEGFLGGTNARDLVGFGNLFMLGTDDVYLDGVNVYLLNKPTKFKENATLRLQVWMTSFTDKGIAMASTPVEGAFLKMKDIKADGEDGAWAPIEGGAVAEFKFDEPLSMYGKTTFFVSVEGFSNDPTTEDFVMLMDVIGKPMSEENAANMLCHNSFARMKGETDYLRPISSYGGGAGTFAICPLISFPENVNAIKGVESNSGNHSFYAHFNSPSTIEIVSHVDGEASIYHADGGLIGNVQIIDGRATIEVPQAGHGLYIVKGPNNKSAKILR